jgi:hypothetical protein
MSASNDANEDAAPNGRSVASVKTGVQIPSVADE